MAVIGVRELSTARIAGNSSAFTALISIWWSVLALVAIAPDAVASAFF